MLDLRPFTGHVVHADRAARVVAPPYDALDPAARAAIAATDPDSYLQALPPGGPPLAGAALDDVLVRCRDRLAELFAAHRFEPLDGPALAVVGFGAGDARALAVVGDVPVAAFGDGRVLPHEQVQDARVHELTRYLEVVGVASSPVAVTQRPDAAVTAATATVVDQRPDVAYRADDGVDVALWIVTDPAMADRLRRAVDGAGVAYIADGHHRGAAAARYAEQVGAGPHDAAGRVLCAILPSDQLHVLPFHRRIDDAEEAVDALAAALDGLADDGVEVTSLGRPTAPTTARRVTVTGGGRWWELDLSAWVPPGGDEVERLDVRAVERDLLPRLCPGRAAQPVAPTLGLDALARPGAIGVALHPPTIDEVLAVSNAGLDLPPKTTYVTPKLRSGLLVTARPRPGAGPPAGAPTRPGPPS